MKSVECANSFVLFPQTEIEHLRSTQCEILEAIKNLQLSSNKASTQPSYLTAVEFMRAVKICITKFDQLSAESKICVIKKSAGCMFPSQKWNAILPIRQLVVLLYGLQDVTLLYLTKHSVMESVINCAKARQIDLVDYLYKLGYSPQRVRGKEYCYLSPLHRRNVRAMINFTRHDC